MIYCVTPATIENTVIRPTAKVIQMPPPLLEQLPSSACVLEKLQGLITKETI